VHGWSKADKGKAQAGALSRRGHEWRAKGGRAAGIKTDGWVMRKGT